MVIYLCASSATLFTCSSSVFSPVFTCVSLIWGHGGLIVGGCALGVGDTAGEI